MIANIYIPLWIPGIVFIGVCLIDIPFGWIRRRIEERRDRALMIRGYREVGGELLHISENTLGAYSDWDSAA